MDHGIVERLLLVITVKGALSTFSAKFILPQPKNSKVTLKGQCLKTVKFKPYFASETKLYFHVKGTLFADSTEFEFHT